MSREAQENAVSVNTVSMVRAKHAANAPVCNLCSGHSEMYREAKITVRGWAQLASFLHNAHKALWQTPRTIQNLACNSRWTDTHTKLPLKY